MDKLLLIFDQYKSAVQRFKEALSIQKSDIVRDSSIKRFEIAYELCWRLLKKVLEVREGIVTDSPKSCFRDAFKANIISYDNSWIRMVETRNNLIHSYDMKYAESIYDESLKKYLEMFEYLIQVIETKIDDK
jgi:nucleotidyltransferase substrate binding protein (TIGR01987 family)